MNFQNILHHHGNQGNPPQPQDQENLMPAGIKMIKKSLNFKICIKMKIQEENHLLR